ncbi:hypothetical protein OSB04_008393 [Centaurea solstitialis]|uniref:Uncharacterized protein n=1 Tax=Centaurea solstitialis TaxID=347529 RepID=A0AA38TLQ4_9ASTR|nr:hypothetical protein OSB04_008393 [Centaurea solstitialis]
MTSSTLVLTTPHLPLNSKFPQSYTTSSSSSTRFQILCSSSGTIGNDGSVTGGAYDFNKATTSVTHKLLSGPKQVTLVRHGLSSWNDESRVQGSSNLSILTETGIMQAERCKKALVDIHFDQCFSSPISRAKSTAEILWVGREEPLIFLDTLKEAHLFHLEGMKNEDAKRIYPKDYTTWREDPSNFHVNGVYPFNNYGTPQALHGRKSCSHLFRAFDVNNGGISVFKFNNQGEAMLQSLNMTAHMYTDHKYRY